MVTMYKKVLCSIINLNFKIRMAFLKWLSGVTLHCNKKTKQTDHTPKKIHDQSMNMQGRTKFMELAA